MTDIALGDKPRTPKEEVLRTPPPPRLLTRIDEHGKDLPPKNSDEPVQVAQPIQREPRRPAISIPEFPRPKTAAPEVSTPAAEAPRASEETRPLRAEREEALHLEPDPPRPPEPNKLGEFLQQCKDFMEQARRRPWWAQCKPELIRILVLLAIILPLVYLLVPRVAPQGGIIVTNTGLERFIKPIRERLNTLAENVAVMAKTNLTLQQGQVELQARIDQTAAALQPLDVPSMQAQQIEALKHTDDVLKEIENTVSQFHH